MSRWSKYSKKSKSSSLDRKTKQFNHTLETWLNKDNNSIIQIARMVREFGASSGRLIDFDDSIEIAYRLSNGRHQ